MSHDELFHKGFHKAELMRSLNPRIFNLFIHPTEQCNYRCTYCYEDFSIGRLPPALVQGTKRLLDRKMPKLDAINVSWFGGEPLLAHDIMLDLSKHARALADEHNVQLYADVTTNASLLTTKLTENFSKCYDAPIDYQVSIDGVEEDHNKTRVSLNKRYGFRKIWDNLIALRDSDLSYKISLRIHVTPNNRDRLPELVEDLKDNFLHDSRFQAAFKAVGDWGGPKSGNISVVSEEDEETIIDRLEAQIHGEDYKKTKTQNSTDQGNYICYASKPNQIIIRADGTLSKCTVKLKDTRNHVGKLTEKGTFDIKGDLFNIWIDGFNDYEESKLGCPAHLLPPEQQQVELVQLGSRALAS